MNLSHRIRICLCNPKTAADVHLAMGGDIALIRGCIQRMVKTGILDRIGDKKPYTYQVSRELKQQNRGFGLKSNTSQKVRDAMKVKNMRPSEVAAELNIKTDTAYGLMRDMASLGMLQKLEDGTYKFIRDPAKPMTKEEAQAKKSAARRLKKLNSPMPHRTADRNTVVRRPPVQKQYTGPKQSVDDWIKSGGVIDRSPTVPKFERLTAEDIAATPFRPSSMQGRTNRAYLAG